MKADAEFQVVERGPHHRIWARVTWAPDARGQRQAVTNQYIELATGLHYADPVTGQWVESREVIEAVAGGAVARQGQHQVEFAANLATAGAIALTLPDGRRVRSHVLGLAWWDAAQGKGVLLGAVQDCVGKLLPPNQVIYEDAFTGVRADVRYTWTRVGLEQDVILRECPPGPERFGLGPKTTRLQVWTEFVEATEARVEEVALATKDGREARDVLVDWGSMAIGPGRAFAVGDAAGEENKLPEGEGAAAERAGAGSVRVSKQWVKIEERRFLVEEVEWGAVRAAVERLPAAAAAGPEAERVGAVARWLPAAPPQQAAKREAAPMQAAQAAISGRGFVVDYVVLNTTQNPYTFLGDTTYFISGQVNLNGTTTLEGGAVIKFRRTNAGLRLNGPWVCRTGPYRPVIFTAQDDNTVGATIAGSTGNPTGYYGNGVTFTKAGRLAHVRLAHLAWAIRYEPWGVPSNSNVLQLAHLQWVRCQVALRVVDAWCFICGATVHVDNALVAQCSTFLEGEEAFVQARHVTVDQCSTLARREGGECTLAVTNSILSAVSTLSSGGASVSGAHNAFYNTQVFGQATIPLESSPFQRVGAGHYYLEATAGNQVRNAGTPNLPSALLEALAQKTTYAPTVVEHGTVAADTCWTAHVLRDADAPDLGYHYEVLDYLVWNVTVAGATLRLAPGCAVAVYGTPGFDLLTGARWESTGTPVNLNRLVRYQAVQEQPVVLGNNPGNMMTLLRLPGSPPPLPQMEFRFTEVALLADSARRRALFDNGGIHQAERLVFTDCRLYGVNLSVSSYRMLGDYRLMSLALTNSLTERCYIWASEESEDPELPSLVVHLRNNLFRHGTLYLTDYLETGAWSVRDNLFDTVALVGLAVANAHNGYISTAGLPGSGGGDKTISPPADYQEGPLGPYYYPTSGLKLAQLIDAGSRTAVEAGLACATTRVDHQPDEGQVDIGFHYRPQGPFWTDYGGTAQELAQWIVGPGLTVQNARFTGAAVAKGTFGNGVSAGFPIDRGVIFSSGDIALAHGPNDQSYATRENDTHGDTDLDALLGAPVTGDAAVLEFDVVATMATNLVFDFIFASEEYPEFVGTVFNDIFAIFVDGVNIAPVLGTTQPASVNNVNGGWDRPEPRPDVPATNPQYYVDNHDPAHSSLAPFRAPCPVYNLQYDGTTVLLRAQTNVAANLIHHVKIAIADANDWKLDSAVFLKAHIACP